MDESSVLQGQMLAQTNLESRYSRRFVRRLAHQSNLLMICYRLLGVQYKSEMEMALVGVNDGMSREYQFRVF